MYRSVCFWRYACFATNTIRVVTYTIQFATNTKHVAMNIDYGKSLKVQISQGLGPIFQIEL